jgi:crotonobetainyl-CoA:carnitine CoA-transferase CaiB-like acyl-CoA transferase
LRPPGADGAAIAAELGYTEAEIAALRESGVITG